MEDVILAHLLQSEKYARKVLPYLKEELFREQNEKLLFGMIQKYIEKYNNIPTKETLYIELGNTTEVSESVWEDTKDLIGNLSADENTNIDWLIDETEKHVQDRTIQNAIRSSIRILDNKGELTKAAIPKLLQDALSVSFNSAVGHDFLEDAQERYESYSKVEKRLRFNLDYLNRITGGGLPPKTLSCILAPTGVGKSLAMCSLAAGNLMDQKNVLYITLEMSEERIAQRIDANLMDVSVQHLTDLTKPEYISKMNKVKESTKGRLIVKEYPTASAGSLHFKNLLDDLKIKKNFIPDVIYIDYLNLCISSRVKMGGGMNSYGYIKAIAEELRGLSVEYHPPIITATQTNRDGYGASDISLTNTSDSIGLPMTVDFMIGITPMEDDDNRIVMKQLKNRFGDPGYLPRWQIGINRAKMRLFDVDNEDDQEDTPVMDNTGFGDRLFDESMLKKDVFKGFGKNE